MYRTRVLPLSQANVIEAVGSHVRHLYNLGREPSAATVPAKKATRQARKT